MKKIVLVFILILIVLAAVLGIDFYRKVFLPYKGYTDTITVEIEKGASVSTIGEVLYRKKIIPSYSYFIIYYRLFFSKTNLQSGEFEFTDPMNMRQIIEKLHKGKVVLYKITIKEGMTINETAEFLENNHGISSTQFLEAARDLEGYLYPDTYLIPRGTGAVEMIELMVKKFKDHFTNSLKWRARDINMSVREVVILASLIEKETAVRDERFLISSVFHNRLRIGMPLACDPTIIYILKKQNRYDGNIRWKDLKMASPYNTRIHKGLPPGPICSPGFASIEAALFPENTKYLYFVSKDGRHHYFSKTLKEHNWAVRKYIINRND
jgi:UPF0755 protein